MKRAARKLITLIAMLCLLFTMAVPAMATETDATSGLTAGEDPTDGILYITLGYKDDNGNYLAFQAGTSFLINQEYVLTNYHVVHVSDDDWDDFCSFVSENFGVTNLQRNDSHISIQIYPNRDMSVAGTIDTNVQSEDMDFAAVKLERTIQDREVIALGSCEDLQLKDTVYALGLPADSILDKNYNTKDDVSVVEGSVSKLTVTSSVDIIEHTAQLTAGNSGGPLLNEANECVGINTFIAGEKNYSIQIDYIKDGLDTFGVSYVEGTGTTSSEDPVEPEPVEPEEPSQELLASLNEAIASAKAYTEEDYTEESYAALATALENAETVAATAETDDEIQSALDSLNDAMNNMEEQSSGLMDNKMLIIIIVAVVAVVVVIIIVVVVAKGKKGKGSSGAANKPQTPPMPNQPMGGQPMGGQPMPNQPFGPQGGMPNQPIPDDAGATSLLDSGAGETTLLGGGAGRAYLLRKKNGEKVILGSQSFKLGRERKRVNYCISDNPSVSRVHCEIVKRGADYYAIDQGSANFTYVNGVQLSPNKETLLTDQSVLKLSDEEFEFHIG